MKARCIEPLATCRADDPCMQMGSGIGNRLTAHLERRQAAGIRALPATQEVSAGLMAIVRDVIERYAPSLVAKS